MVTPISHDVVFQQVYGQRVARLHELAYAQGKSDGMGSMFGLVEYLEKTLGRPITSADIREYFKQQFLIDVEAEQKARREAQSTSTVKDDVPINKKDSTSKLPDVSDSSKVVNLFQPKKK